MKTSTRQHAVLSTLRMFVGNGTISSHVKSISSFMFSLILLLIFQVNSASAQLTTSGAVSPGTSPNFCPNCTAEDIKVTSVDILRLEGTGCYNNGDLLDKSKFVFTLDVTAKQRYGLVIYFELWQKGGISPLQRYYVCADKIFSKGVQTFPGNAINEPEILLQPGLRAGDIEIRNVFTGWDNQNTQTFCDRTSFDGTIITPISSYKLVYGYEGNFLIKDCKRITPKCKSYLSLPLKLPVTPYITLADPMPSLCQGGTSANLNYTSVSSNADKYSIVYSNGGISPVAETSLPSSSPIVLSLPGSLSAGTYNATIKVNNSKFSCSSTADFTITVRPQTTIAAIQSTIAGPFCSSSTAPQLSVEAAGSGNITYQWYKNNSNSNSGGTKIDGATGATYTPSLATTGIKYYYVVATADCGSASSPAYGITVLAPTQITTNCNSSNSYCKDVIANDISVVATGASLTYQWYSNVSNSTSDGSIIGGETKSNYKPSTSSEGTMYYYVVVSGSCGTVTSGVATITVKKSTVINNQPSCSGSFCKNTPATELNVVADGVNLKYQWYSNSINATSGCSTLNGETNASFTPPTSVAGTKYYYVVVTGDCGKVTSLIIPVKVDETTEIKHQPSCAGSYCKNASAAALSVTAIGSNVTYQWYSNTTNGTANASSVASATDSRYTPPTSEAGDMYYFVEVMGDCGSVKSDLVKITVKKITEIITDPSCNTSYCKNEGAAAMTVVAEGVNLQYQWYSNTISGTTGSSIIDGATDSRFTPPTSVAGSKYYYVVVTGDCGTVTSSSVEIMVDETTEIKNQPTCSASSYCQYAQADDLVVTAIGTNLTYQWFSNTTNGTADASSVASATDSRFTPPTSDAGDIYYFVEVKGDCGTEKSDVIKVSVKKATSISNQPTCGHSFCEGSEVDADLVVEADGTNIEYQWYSNSISSTTDASSVASATDSRFTPPTNTVGTQFYFVVVKGECGELKSSIVEIMIDPLTEITEQPSCSGSPYCQDDIAEDLTVKAVGSNVEYQWYISTSNSTADGVAIAGATSTAITPSTETAGEAYYYVLVTGECNSETSIFTKITVHAKPSINEGGQPQSQSACLGSEVEPLTVSASGYQLNYVWYSYGTDRSDAVSVGNTSALSVNSDAVGVNRYFVIVSGACSPAVTSDCISVTINETTEFNDASPDSYTVCKNGDAKYLFVHATGSNISYQWYSSSSNTNEGGVAIPDATDSRYTPPVDNSGITYYYAIASTEYCNSVTSDVAEVQVNDCGAFCTYTQGYYGNDNVDGGGIAKYDGHCVDGGTRVLATINNALNAICVNDKLILGCGDFKVTINKSDAVLIRQFLPRGGTPDVLKRSYSMYELANSSIKNNLLSQTMTLALNIGLNKGKDIINYPLQPKYLTTLKAMSCSSTEGMINQTKQVNFSGITDAMDIGIDEAGTGAGDGDITIGEILRVANKVLGGQAPSGITATQMANIAAAINEGFDECRIADSYSNDPTLSVSSLTTGIAVRAYPNPFVSSFNIVFTSNIDGDAKVDFYDESGRNLGSILRNNVIAGIENTIEYKAPLNSPAVIFYRLTIGSNIVSGKVLSHVTR